MEVGHGQQVVLTGDDPAFRRQELARGTVPVAAGVEDQVSLAAMVTGIEVPTKRWCTAPFDHCAEVVGRHAVGVLFSVA